MALSPTEFKARQKHQLEELRELQAQPLERKVMITQTRLIEWYQHYEGNVCLSYSGGKDSTVLLYILRQMYKDVPAVFANTGLEYPEIRKFALSQENVIEVQSHYGRLGQKYGRSKDAVITFHDTVTLFGYPIISKEISSALNDARHYPTGVRMRQLKGVDFLNGSGRFSKTKYAPLYEMPFKITDRCCNYIKKRPLHQYQTETKRQAIVATTTEESLRRESAWLLNGCNAFNAKTPRSAPMSFWKEQDILHYIVRESLPICSVYGDIVYTDSTGLEYDARNSPFITRETELRCSGCKRTGCVFCAYGMHLEKGETRFQRLKRTHPRLYEYSIGGGEWKDNPDYDKAKDGTEYWNPKQIWIPNRQGLGMGKVFDMVNEIYGKDFLRYE